MSSGDWIRDGFQEITSSTPNLVMLVLIVVLLVVIICSVCVIACARRELHQDSVKTLLERDFAHVIRTTPAYGSSVSRRLTTSEPEPFVDVDVRHTARTRAPSAMMDLI
ncbi:Uncharacterized protein PBTT_08869 [Plasmodiophora brassicae]|uniref:Uncharacterized protein n=1 Tax=Plasmodiophora brassicae TaxID=37360 RepID=A0A3P3YKP3_PLABS|nr:unnamed protein product [Plasmodiophora brassicae]